MYLYLYDNFSGVLFLLSKLFNALGVVPSFDTTELLHLFKTRSVSFASSALILLERFDKPIFWFRLG